MMYISPKLQIFLCYYLHSAHPSSVSFPPKQLHPASSLLSDLCATESMRWVKRTVPFPGVCTQETLHKNPAMSHTDVGVSAGFENAVYLRIRGCSNRSLHLMVQQIDAIMPTSGCHLGGGESLICHLHSAGCSCRLSGILAELMCRLVLTCPGKNTY